MPTGQWQCGGEERLLPLKREPLYDKKIVIIVTLSIGLFAYCTSSTKEIDNIELSHFAKELINLYITEYSQT